MMTLDQLYLRFREIQEQDKVHPDLDNQTRLYSVAFVINIIDMNSVYINRHIEHRISDLQKLRTLATSLSSYPTVNSALVAITELKDILNHGEKS